MGATLNPNFLTLNPLNQSRSLLPLGEERHRSGPLAWVSLKARLPQKGAGIYREHKGIMAVSIIDSTRLVKGIMGVPIRNEEFYKACWVA